jgi:hypothetical protein
MPGREEASDATSEEAENRGPVRIDASAH